MYFSKSISGPFCWLQIPEITNVQCTKAFIPAVYMGNMEEGMGGVPHPPGGMHTRALFARRTGLKR